MNNSKISYNNKNAPTIKIQRFSLEKNKSEIMADKIIADKNNVIYKTGDERKKILYDLGFSEKERKQIQNIVNQKVAKTYVSINDINGLNDVISESEIMRCLKSMSFSLSRSDINGNFSLSLFPETSTNESIFDLINILDIVSIYEWSINKKTKDKKKVLVFQGIVKEKRINAQTANNGGIRTLNITGLSVASLLNSYVLNLDTSAQAITGQFVETTSINKKLANKLNETKGEPCSVAFVIQAIFESFENVARSAGTFTVGEMLKKLCGDSISQICDIDESYFYYPLATVFNGEQTQSFFDLIDGIIPEPIYEKFAFTDRTTQKMRLKIRECPFPYTENSVVNSEKWDSLEKTEIDAKTILNFDFSVSDKEVYTVFYAYLNGYPIDEQKALRLSMIQDEKTDEIATKSEKFAIYGYKPLIAHFLGYGLGSAKLKDDSTKDKLKKANEKLKSWYENLPSMFSGSLTLAMCRDVDCAIMPGEKIKLFGGEFYVESVAHNWNYSAGGTVQLSLNRGGRYTENGFKELQKVGTMTSLLSKKKYVDEPIAMNRE